MSALLKCSSAIFKLPFLPSVGLLRTMIGNTDNSGDLKIYKMLEEMFFEPTDVLLELVAGMQSAGLRLTKEGAGGGENGSGRDRESEGDRVGEGELESQGAIAGQRTHISTPPSTPPSTTSTNGTTSAANTTSNTTSTSSSQQRERTRRGSPSVFCSTTVAETDVETFHIEDHLGNNESNILLICGTEDLLVPEADVIATFEAIVENARLDPSREYSFCSKIISVGKKAGYRSSYSHFDLIFSVDAVIDVFPQILDFINLTENKDKQCSNS
jgi:hypothetical protein